MKFLSFDQNFSAAEIDCKMNTLHGICQSEEMIFLTVKVQRFMMKRKNIHEYRKKAFCSQRFGLQ